MCGEETAPFLGYGLPSLGPQPQRSPGTDRLRLSSAPSRLGNCPKPLASAFPSASWEGLNTTR